MLTQRSQKKELLDLGPDYYSAEEYEHCLKMLFKVNKVFGFFGSTMRLLRRFSNDFSLLDVGCGGGLFLLHLSHYFPATQLMGTDISFEAIQIAQKELHLWQKKAKVNINVDFQWQQQATFSLSSNSIDIILATMVCHHLSDKELIDFLQQATLAARKAVIINDLQRHSIAQWLYAMISPVLFRNRLITHDGLISISRGFTRAEWKLLLHHANIKNYKIKWCFPFRWMIVISKVS